MATPPYISTAHPQTFVFRANGHGHKMESATGQPIQSPRLRDTRFNRHHVNRSFGSPSIATNETFSYASRFHRHNGGQQFRVGNIGHNGTLYLRPVARPSPQLISTPPMTPPSAHPEEVDNDAHNVSHDWREDLFSTRDFLWSPQLSPERTPRTTIYQQPSSDRQAQRPYSHGPPEADGPIRDTQADLAQAPPLSALQTSKLPPASHMLEVSIPHYRLGTPHFTNQGSPLLRSSMHTRSSMSDDQRHSTSINHVDNKQPWRQSVQGKSLLSHSRTSDMTRAVKLSLHSEREALRGQVRFSTTTGQIMAATPAGLIAQITSPHFLDYELLSDFFLTFRAYIRATDLVDFLIARLQWAVERRDDFGSVTRVRTFVALRHWILNYFMDDFAPDYSLRVQFCDLANDLCSQLRLTFDGGAAGLKIIGELKKCWRRTCALYWDIPNHQTENPVVDVLPGGLLGSRDASVEGPMNPEQHRSSILFRKLDAGSFGHLRSIQPSRETVLPTSSIGNPHASLPLQHATPSTSNNRISDEVATVDWCSGPRRAFQRHIAKPRRVNTSRFVQGSATTGAANEFTLHHEKISAIAEKSGSNSVSPASRNLRAIPSPPESLSDGLQLPFPGSLIRGVALLPRSDVLESQPLDTSSREQSQVTPVLAAGPDETVNNSRPSPAIKKLFDPVRRVLSTKRGIPPSYLEYQQRRRQVTSVRHDVRQSPNPDNPAPHTTTVVGKSRLRTDLLAAQILESFNKVLKEQQDAKTLKDAFQSGRNSNLDPLKSNPVRDDNTIVRSMHGESVRQTGQSSEDSSDLTPSSPIEPIASAGVDEQDRTALPPGVEKPTRVTSILHALPATKASHQASRSIMTPQRRRMTHQPSYETITRQASIDLLTPPQHRIIHQPSYESMDQLNAAGVVRHIPGESFSRPFYSNPLETHPQVRKDDKIQSSGMDGTQAQNTMSSNNDPFYAENSPPRQLRRLPGGNLRATNHVHSLIGGPRPLTSMSSRDARSEDDSQQVSAEGLVNPNDSDLAGVAKTVSRSSIPILSTPPLQDLGSGRSSFNDECAKLAQVPDDQEDEGGVESALRKLEGLVDQKDIEFPVPPGAHLEEFGAGTLELQSTPPNDYGHIHLEEEIFVENIGTPYQSRTPDEVDPVTTVFDTKDLAPRPVDSAREMSSKFQAVSDSSDSSTPLLERGITSHVFSRKRRSSSEPLASSETHPSPEQTRVGETENNSGTEDALASSDVVITDEKPGTVDRNTASAGQHDSMLDDDPHVCRHSSMSRKDSQDDEHTPIPEGNGEFKATSGVRLSDIPIHPFRHPSTPARTSYVPPVGVQIDASKAPQSIRHIPLKDRVEFHARASAQTQQTKSTTDIRNSSIPPSISPTSTLNHLPFVLYYDALLIAQQLTLVEKDAVSEIDWRELIELRWRQAPSDTRNWVDHLQFVKQSPLDPRLRGGVDLCISRFNVMVKWAASEIVLTEDLLERAACLTKYIHIAEHARQMHNWATMFQITMALVGGDISRLKKTWALVAPRDIEILNSLETLIMPTKNFHNLRREMESAINGTGRATSPETPMAGTNGGCIPFIGIYTHDLIYNAQKPAYVQKSLDEQHGNDINKDKHIETVGPMDDSLEVLVNFERHCTAASIVKNLLRMVEASGLYTFRPDSELLSRCLWIAALSDAEIERMSRVCET